MPAKLSNKLMKLFNGFEEEWKKVPARYAEYDAHYISAEEFTGEEAATDEILMRDVAAFVLYLVNFNGKVTELEARFYNIFAGTELTAEEIAALPAAKPEGLPVSMQLAITRDALASNYKVIIVRDYSRDLLRLYTSIADAIPALDDNRDARKWAKAYINAMGAAVTDDIDYKSEDLREAVKPLTANQQISRIGGVWQSLMSAYAEYTEGQTVTFEGGEKTVPYVMTSELLRYLLYIAEGNGVVTELESELLRIVADKYAPEGGPEKAGELIPADKLYTIGYINGITDAPIYNVYEAAGNLMIGLDKNRKSAKRAEAYIADMCKAVQSKIKTEE